MSDLRVYLCPSDLTGCGHYRMLWPAFAAYTATAGEVSYSAQMEPLAIRADREGNVVDVPQIDADVLVLQRPLGRAEANAIPFFQAQGVAVVVELDDDIAAAQPDHPVYASVQPALRPDQNWRWLQKACAYADLVTCSTPALAQAYAPEKSIVIPNYVPRSFLRDPAGRESNSPLVVAWSGSAMQHPGDAEVTDGAVARALEATGARFHVVGDGVGAKERLGIKDWVTAEYVPLVAYPNALAATDVIIAPLRDDEFTRAKSWCKVLEASAVGVPSIASPSPEYARAQTEGLCTVVSSPGAWEQYLALLLSNDDLRASTAAFRFESSKAFVLEDHVNEWVAAWWSAAERRARM